MVREVLERQPYPGDLDDLGNRWVTDTALDLIAGTTRAFVCLPMREQYFAMRHVQSLTEIERTDMVYALFQEVDAVRRTLRVYARDRRDRGDDRLPV